MAYSDIRLMVGCKGRRIWGWWDGAEQNLGMYEISYRMFRGIDVGRERGGGGSGEEQAWENRKKREKRVRWHVNSGRYTCLPKHLVSSLQAVLYSY